MANVMDAGRVFGHVRDAGTPWQEVVTLARVDSTNAAVCRDPRPWVAVAAEEQTAGRGRLGRSWATPPGQALAVSALLPPVPQPTWLPLLTGLAVRDAVAEVAGLEVVLKWPNDVLVPAAAAAGTLAGEAGTLNRAEGTLAGEAGTLEAAGGKLAGILCELVPQGVVVGIGLNVGQARQHLPVPTATSLALAGATDVDREALLGRLLVNLAAVHADLSQAGQGEPRLAAAYRRACSTIGQEVLVHLPGGARQALVVTDVDRYGRLSGRDHAGRPVVLSAGDVVHVRPAVPAPERRGSL